MTTATKTSTLCAIKIDYAEVDTNTLRLQLNSAWYGNEWAVRQSGQYQPVSYDEHNRALYESAEAAINAWLENEGAATDAEMRIVEDGEDYDYELIDNSGTYWVRLTAVPVDM